MTIPTRQRMLGCVALTCALLLLADRLILSPYLDAYREHSREIRQLEEELKQNRALLALAPRWRERLDWLTARAFPASPSKAEHQILGALRKWGDDSGLELETVRPRRVAQRKAPAMLDVRLTARGNITSVVRFLYELETAPMPIQVQKTDLSASKSGPGKLALTIQLLVLLEQGTVKENAT